LSRFSGRHRFGVRPPGTASETLFTKKQTLGWRSATFSASGMTPEPDIWYSLLAQLEVAYGTALVHLQS
jgi:hypothetical protein